ncbi:lysozyme inhibitor LprI family protein [Leptolyngbya sp. DQ-M1]|uniref:lysozyme inhibitor LprI family protein n=1 Tax=Leptolyngbya sp. DQ-M1 TaxID=2933920 RepID=UPI003297F69D
MQWDQSILGITALLIGSAMYLNVPTQAQSNRPPINNQPSNIKIDCQNPRSQFDLNFCAAERVKTAEQQLNQAYQRAIAKFKGTPQEAQLIAAQSAWTKFRDADCAFVRDRFKGGSMAPMVYSSCIARLSQQRRQELLSYLTETGL